MTSLNVYRHKKNKHESPLQLNHTSQLGKYLKFLVV